MAIGMARLGLVVSSPREAAASKPANDKKPNTMPKNRVLVDIPGGTVNMSRVKRCPPGALPATTRITTTTAMTTMTAVVQISTHSRVAIDFLTGEMASSVAMPTATRAMIQG